MKRLKAAALAALILSVAGCGTVPQSRQHYIETLQDYSGFGSSQKMIFSKTVNQSFEPAVSNIEDKLMSCIPEGYSQTTVRGIGMSSLSVKNNQRVERASPDKAEVTVQQFHSSTAMQSKGGFYLLAADVLRQGPDAVRIDFYTSKHYSGIADAIVEWAKGSEKCHGIGGND